MYTENVLVVLLLNPTYIWEEARMQSSPAARSGFVEGEDTILASGGMAHCLKLDLLDLSDLSGVFFS